MGLFFGGYDTPGAGVDPNAPKKKGFFLYIELVMRKFMKFVQTGFLYNLFALPLLVLIYFASAFVLHQPIASLQNTALGVMQSANVAEADISPQLGTIVFFVCAMTAIFFVNIWGAGPLSAAMSYVYRSFTREEHVWIFSDGKDKVRENMKQGLLMLLIDILVFIFAPTAMIFYYNLAKADAAMNTVCTVLIYLVFLALVIYTMMHPYMFQLMVTFKASFKELFKNAVMLTLAHLPLNLLLTAISAAAVVLPIAVGALNGTAILIFAVFTFGTIIFRYPMEFYASRVIDKTILNNKNLQSKRMKIEYEEEDQ